MGKKDNYTKVANIIKNKINKISQNKLWADKLMDIQQYCEDQGRRCDYCIFNEDNFCEINNELNDYPDIWDYTSTHVIKLMKILAPNEIRRKTKSYLTCEPRY